MNRPDSRDHPAAQREEIVHLLVGHEIQIALAIAGLHVRQAVPLLGRGQEGLGEKRLLSHVDGELAGARAEEAACDAQEVAQVQVAQAVVGLLAQGIPSQVGLELAGAVTKVKEGRATHVAHGRNATRHPHLGRRFGGAGFLPGLESLQRRGGGVSAPVARRVGVDAALAQAGQLGLSLLVELVLATAHEGLTLESAGKGSSPWRSSLQCEGGEPSGPPAPAFLFAPCGPSLW